MNAEDSALDAFVNDWNHSLQEKKTKKRNPRNPRNQTEPLKARYSSTPSIEYELGIDEAGRGPMFGPVYVACVVLPPPTSDFRFDWMKDSKRFSSHRKITSVADYIKEHAVAYSIQSCSADEIDKMNIRQAVLKSMHMCIDDIHKQLNITPDNTILLVDGCDFVEYHTPNSTIIPHTTIEGGDNWYCAIAAASILAKVARDEYIMNLCDQYPLLDEWYGLRKNKGYGTTQHRKGIEEHGITPWHRKTFGMCREYAVNSNYQHSS